MKSKLEELLERYMRDGFPSRLQIQQDMTAAVAEEKKESLGAELLRFVDHRIALAAESPTTSPMIYPAEVRDILRRHGI